MKIFSIISILLLFVSCEIEKLEPNDVIEENPPGWGPGSEPIDPADVVVPCTLQPNLIRFNNQNSNVGTVYVNSPGYSFPSATYSVVVPMISSQELELYFTEEPPSGYYSTVTQLNDQLTGEEVVAQVFTGGSYFTANAGGNLYVQNYGDSIRISYCDLDFSNSFTINSKAQFVY